MISSAPAPTSPNSNAIIPGTENRECAPWTPGNVKPSRISPAAVSVSPIHWRRPTRTPSIRSAITASSTTPPASTAWTIDRGAADIAATWNTHAALPISIPIENDFTAKSDRAVFSGWRMSTLGAALAPRCL